MIENPVYNDYKSTKELCKLIAIKGSKNDIIEEFPVNINSIHFRRIT